MATFQDYKNTVDRIKQGIASRPSYDQLQRLYTAAFYILQDFKDEKEYVFKITGYVKFWCANLLNKTGNAEYNELYYKTLLLEAQNHNVDSGLLYLERYRDPEDKFYMPRRKQFLEYGLVQALQELIDDNIDILSLSLPPGTGKAEPLDVKVLTPNGFINMGDVKVGQKIIAGDGTISTVLGVFPQGEKDVYRIKFSDGTSVECCKEHLWKVQTRDDRNKKRCGNNKYRIVETQDMMKNIRVEKEQRLNYSVDFVSPVQFEKKYLRIDPYVLGVIIGDGCLMSSTPVVDNTEDDIFDKVKKNTTNGDVVKWISISSRRCKRFSFVGENTTKSLKEYGLYEKYSYEKFIPYDYLHSSVEDRLELLRGLCDTDGSVSRGEFIDYSTESEKLADDIVYLVRSLGGRATINTSGSHYIKDGIRVECLTRYRITLSLNGAMIPVSSKKHLKKYVANKKVTKKFIESIEYSRKAECQCIYIDHPDHLYVTDDFIVTHNTTLGEMFVSLFIGWYPDTCNLFSSHSGHVTRMVYDVVCNVIGINLKKGQIAEYAWKEIFPNVQFENCNAQEQTINLGKFKPFKSLTCRALGASQTGVTRAEGLLYCDDLCSGIEQALSKIRLDKLWTMYSTDLKTRKKKGKGGRTCKEIHIATRWSVWDVIGRIKNIYENNKRCKFISIPDINPETGESNFDFLYGVGFDVEYFEDIEKSLDDITYKCLYKNEPVEREGILYNPDILNRSDTLPEREPDGIWAFCDTKDTGTDYNCLGVFYQYGKDYYLYDVVFQNIDPYLLDDINADCLVRNKVHIAVFESNKEGGRTGDKVQEKVKEKGGRCSIQKRYTTQNKETKIIVNSPWVIEHVIFKYPKSEDHPDGYEVKSDYGQFMSWLCAYSQLAKNPKDDAPDMVSMLAVYMTKGISATVTAVKNPLWG